MENVRRPYVLDFMTGVHNSKRDDDRSALYGYIHTYIHTLLARPHGAFQSQFYITKL